MSADTFVALFRRNIDGGDFTEAERSAYHTMAKEHPAAFEEARRLGPLAKPRIVVCPCAGCTFMRIAEEQAQAAQ